MYVFISQGETSCQKSYQSDNWQSPRCWANLNSDKLGKVIVLLIFWNKVLYVSYKLRVYSAQPDNVHT